MHPPRAGWGRGEDGVEEVVPAGDGRWGRTKDSFVEKH